MAACQLLAEGRIVFSCAYIDDCGLPLQSKSSDQYQRHSVLGPASVVSLKTPVLFAARDGSHSMSAVVLASSCIYLLGALKWDNFNMDRHELLTDAWLLFQVHEEQPAALNKRILQFLDGVLSAG